MATLSLPLQKLLKSDRTSLGDGFRPHGELGGSNRIELGSINDKELEGCTLNIQPFFFLEFQTMQTSLYHKSCSWSTVGKCNERAALRVCLFVVFAALGAEWESV